MALKVTQIRSAIGSKPKQRGTLRALGLRRIGASRIHQDNAVVRGMIARVPHLVEVAEVNEDAEVEVAEVEVAEMSETGEAPEEDND